MEPATSLPDRFSLLDLSPPSLRELLSATLIELGEPGYRAQQIERWIFERLAVSFSEMTDLPLRTRSLLENRFSLGPLRKAFAARSSDGTIKHLWSLGDGEQVESVLIPAEGRTTLCLSSQAGCALGCRFCATGDMGLRRQLRTGEIVAQFRDAQRACRAEGLEGIANVVYMGMGEPFANLEAVLASLTTLHRGFGLGARRITVSTVGLVPGIRALARRPEAFRLAVSLHAPNHQLRLRLVPVEKRYPIPTLFEALRDYQRRKGRRVSLEYILIEGINDDPELALELAERIGDLDAFVNLIPYNPVPGRDWKPSPERIVRRFLSMLERKGVPTAVRQPRGRDIAAACGQLRLERSSGIPASGGPRG